MPRERIKLIAWWGYSWMGMLTMFIVFFFLVEMVQFGYTQFFNPTIEELISFNRSLIGGVVMLTVLLLLIGLYEAKKDTPIKNVRIPIDNLPSAFNGFRIVQLTDIHVGPTVGSSFIKELVKKTNAMEPDLIAITGDLVDGRVHNLGPIVSELKNLRAKYGVYFVTGNHEYYSGVQEWVAFLPSLGIRVLSNERDTLECKGAFLDIAGIHDPTGRQMGQGFKPDLEAALEGWTPSRPLILLAHQPRPFAKAAKYGISLQLSGHTHGGQFFPFNLAVKAVEPYVKGLYREGKSVLYVSTGNAYWGPPFRVGVPRELTCIELVASS